MGVGRPQVFFIGFPSLSGSTLQWWSTWILPNYWFLIIGSTEAECQAAFLCLLQLLQDLGFDISWHKVVHPTQCLTFLGIELDTIKQCMALPHNNLVELQGVVHSFSGHTRASKRQLQQLAGKLNWACRVVFGGHTFLRHILDIISSLMSPSARYKLSLDFYADIQWWCEFLKTFNGKQLFLSSTAVEVATDACPQAAGAFLEGDWLYYNFRCETPSWSALHINHKEALAIYLAAECWAPLWANRQVVICSDNHAAVAMINKGTTSNTVVMKALCRLFWSSAMFNFRLVARYIPGKSNGVADAFSWLYSSSHLLYAWEVLCNMWGAPIPLVGGHPNQPYASCIFSFPFL